ncbi:hypothetical protein HNQ07_000634 [Deinococcus metalli]|uniref:DUF2087 domain-containing protein n=1 Tax=Deinococcus metalli TaxID=1141878 RepID=A0A7W8KBK8_9DEIO|nr:hypothetical protein [Deinococcus metalli]MBB5375190.1 hypothetical protein [Deinococcus metalli]GHF31082.1 hypothetical protein GCM10017781_04070 [Deinococcus metalli]
MAAPIVEVTALKVILELPSGTDLSDRDLQRELRSRLPADAACADLGAIRELAGYLASLGYLMVRRDEPGLYRIP